MAKVRLHPLFESFRGKIRGMVFRLSHNGKISAYMSPDMTGVKWSPAQVAQRERLAEASAYAKAATADPQLRAFYVQMSMEKKGNKRPYDMAVGHYLDGNNLLGDRFRWDVEHWREMKCYRRKRKR
jgi:hypothetical protein